MKVLDLYITKVCNLHCDYCYVDLVDSEHKTEFGTIDKKIKLLEYDHIKFFGGEPLLRFDLIQQIVSSVRQKRKDTLFTIVTNGLLLDNKKNAFFIEHGINIVLSFHKKGAKKLLEVIQKIEQKSSLNLSLIFEGKDMFFPYKMVKLLHHLGFTNFIFSPEIYSSWGEDDLKILETQLEEIFEYSKNNNDVNIGGFEKYNLQRYERDCHKSIFDEKGDYHKCNRFKAISDNGVDYDEVYDFFEDAIKLKQNPLRWFYTCPIGWYLDSQSLSGKDKKLLISRAKAYDRLNKIFIAFYKKVVHANNIFSYYRDDISEIRLNLTDQCNIRCEYCYVDFKTRFLDENVGKEIIEFYLEQEGNDKVISFFGGEPLLAFSLLKNLVHYARSKAKELGKKVTFKIATNFLLVTQEIIEFISSDDFTIHISWNGLKAHHDASRDDSYDILLQKMKAFGSLLNKEKVVILYVISPGRCGEIVDDIKHIAGFGFQRFNLEFFLEKDYKHSFSKTDITLYIEQLKKLLKLPDISLQNLASKGAFLDISTTGKCSDNSLAFHGYAADFKIITYMNDIVKKIFL